MIFKQSKDQAFNRTLAAVDLGSNSFHMIVARANKHELQIQDRLREMVRLGAGLDAQGNLSEEAQLRALECLERFGQRLRGLPVNDVRIVGTNTLRKARGQNTFLQQAQQALGYPVEIISGIEEARLIYLGVSHSLAEDGMRRMVIDIGGGSTEVIIGERFEPILMESLYMGCVSMSREFFAEGVISKERLDAAELAAQLELEGIVRRYHVIGWDQTVGASGTAKAIARVVEANGWSSEGITPKSLKQLRKAILQATHIDELKLKGMSEERRPVFLGGFAIMSALFYSFDIEKMLISDGALREGLLYEMLGRAQHADVREHSIGILIKRYQVDTDHAKRVEQTALALLQQVAVDWKLTDPNYALLLGWAARLHEIGLAIAHSGYHKHGAYLLEYSDLSGFSLQEQQLLAILVRSHRRKLDTNLFSALPKALQTVVIKLAILLRIAVKLQRSRLDAPLPTFIVKAREKQLTLTFPADWLQEHALTYMDLERETQYLAQLDYQLELNSTE